MRMRGASDVSISDTRSGRGRCRDVIPLLARVCDDIVTFSSTRVFHAPHALHRPSHFGKSFPHELHTHTVFVFAIADDLFFSV